jgi:putative iron-only hydrogenase system regulator
VTILLDRQQADVGHVNELLSQFGDSVIGRLGLPYPERGVNIITVIVDVTVERLSALTGKLGRLRGVQVKSLMARAAPGAETSHDHAPE